MKEAVSTNHIALAHKKLGRLLAFCGASALACTLLSCAATKNAGQVESPAAGDSSSQSKTNYKVKVELREAKNRIVEGRVRNHTLVVDQPKEFGADDTAPTPPETLAFALGACVVSTGRLMAMQKKLNIKSIHATVEGELDFAKAMGMEVQQRAGFRGLRVGVTIESDMTPEQKAAFLQDLISRCPMCDNLSNTTPVAIELK